jgi:HEAT repeat protein
MIGDESCVAALIESLTDPYETVRKYAVQALARIGDRSAVEHLLGALEDEDTYVRGRQGNTSRDI